MEPLAVLILVWIMLILGLVGTILPVLPGTGLIFGGILLYAFYFGVDSVGLSTLVLFGVATALSFIIDLLGSLYGASRFGASRSGLVGSFIGGLVGLVILNLPGLFLGFFLGAVAGELLFQKKNLNDALKAGVGSVLGFLGGTIVKFILSLVMVIVFVAKAWF